MLNVITDMTAVKSAILLQGFCLFQAFDDTCPTVLPALGFLVIIFSPLIRLHF